MKPTIESDGQGNFWIRDGRGLQEVTPVVIIGQVDPDERVAGDHGTGINLTQPVLEDNSEDILGAIQNGLEGFYGDMEADKGPSPIVCHTIVQITDALGDVTGTIVGAPGAGYSHRVVEVWFQGIALVGCELVIHDSALTVATLRLDVVNRGNHYPVNIKLGDNEAITATISGGGNAVRYVCGVVYRTETT